MAEAQNQTIDQVKKMFAKGNTDYLKRKCTF